MATLTFQYDSRTVWLDDLGADAEPCTMDLCGRHADRLSPPRGWSGTDRRRSLGDAGTDAPPGSAGAGVLRAQAS